MGSVVDLVVGSGHGLGGGVVREKWEVESGKWDRKWFASCAPSKLQ